MRRYPVHFCLLTFIILVIVAIAAAQTPNAAVDHYRDGARKVSKGDLDGAIEDYSRAIAISSRFGSANAATNAETKDVRVIDPFTANAYINRGVVLYRKGNLQEALTDFNAAIRIRPGLAQAYLNRAATVRELGDLNRALLDLDKAISIDPKLFEAYNNRGTLRHDLGDLTGAEADFDRAI